jgi:hypothetical protein
MKPRTEKALGILEASDWVCAQELVEAGVGYAYGARIYELRQSGVQVIRRQCKDPAHRHRAVMWEYAIKPGQIRLPVGDGR